MRMCCCLLSDADTNVLPSRTSLEVGFVLASFIQQQHIRNVFDENNSSAAIFVGDIVDMLLLHECCRYKGASIKKKFRG